MIDLLAFDEFTLHNFIRNKDDRILDFVLSTTVEVINLNESYVAIVTPDSYHPPVEFHLSFPNNTPLRDKASSFIFLRKQITMDSIFFLTKTGIPS